MSIMRKTPLREFENLIGRWPVPWRDEDFRFAMPEKWQPSVDIVESDKEFLIKVEVPEIKKEDLHVEIDAGVLSIKGERREEVSDKKRHRLERYYGAFERSFALPENVREEGIKARVENGMLYIHLGKTDLKKEPRKLEIKVG